MPPSQQAFSLGRKSKNNDVCHTSHLTPRQQKRTYYELQWRGSGCTVELVLLQPALDNIGDIALAYAHEENARAESDGATGSCV
jgi:hypothetical protein